MHVPEFAKFKTPARCKFGDTYAYKHTAKLAAEKKISALIAGHIPSNDDRQMQIRKIQ